MILPLEEHLFPDLLAALAEIPVALRNLLNRKEWFLIINYLKSSRIFTKSSKLLNNDVEVILSFNSFH